MKRTKKEFNEALGVPDNIVNAARDAFEDFKREFKKVLNRNETEYEFNYSPDKPYRIGDMEIKNINYEVKLHETNRTDEVRPISMGVKMSSKDSERFNKPVLISVDKQGNSNLQIDLSVPEDWDENDVLDYFNKNKVKNVKTFSHELKHEYDEYKIPFQTLSSRVIYTSIKKLMGGIPPMNDFIFKLYFISRIESLVRPSEVAAEIDELGISKKQFLDFLLNNATYQELKDINQFSVDKLKGELKDYVGEIRDILSNLENEDDPFEKTDEEVIDRLLEIYYITITNNNNSMFYNYLVSDPFQQIFGLPPKEDKWFKDFAKKNQKYHNNPLRFYDNMELEFKYKSRKMMKKLSKLYDYIK